MSAGPARYDLIIIGAGINGAAIAREAALSRLKVLLLDQADVGGGASAASTRLIHGGLRYLEHAELNLVRESLRERERLLRLAPHLVAPLPMYLPLYRGGRRKRWQIRAGMWLYDLLSTPKSVPRHRMLARDALLARLPGLAGDSLLGGAHYFDAQVVYPERLVVENVLDAVANGAVLRTYTRAVRISVDRGNVRGVEWRRRDGDSGHAAADVVVNAAGPWVDRVLAGVSTPPLIGATKGSHLICAPFPGAPAGAVYSEAAEDGRPFFIVPWNGLYLIGTTDERYTGDPGDARISTAECDYLLGAAERLFPSAAPLRRFVRYTQAGVRPLPTSPQTEAGRITRSHLIHAHGNARGLYSVVGGKLTTHRALAEDVLRRVRRRLPAVAPESPTRERALPGAVPEPEREARIAEVGARVGAEQAERLWRIYGSRSHAVAQRAASSVDLAMAVGPNAKTLVAELVHALEDEWASSLVDILHRRCMAGLDADSGLQTAPAAAEWLVRLGVWDKVRGQQEVVAHRSYARRFALPDP
jgi:glycerol-3-phosphate dehydrogenase